MDNFYCKLKITERVPGEGELVLVDVVISLTTPRMQHFESRARKLFAQFEPGRYRIELARLEPNGLWGSYELSEFLAAIQLRSGVTPEDNSYRVRPPGSVMEKLRRAGVVAAVRQTGMPVLLMRDGAELEATDLLASGVTKLGLSAARPGRVELTCGDLGTLRYDESSGWEVAS